MPPKRKAPSKAASSKPKITKKDSMSSALEALSSKSDNKRTVFEIDDAYHGPKEASSCIYKDYDCMLNQTNVSANNNKYYIIQVIMVKPKVFYCWNRWGRVGEPGASALKGPFDTADKAVKDFEKKFRDKTANSWADKDNFQPVAKKYTLMVLANKKRADDSSTASSTEHAPSKLDPETKRFVELIFEKTMFESAMSNMNIDMQKLPLGELSNQQILKAFEALVELRKAIVGKQSLEKVNQWTSKFYTLIPHNFGRSKPLPITTEDQVRDKIDMLLILSDIAQTQDMQKEASVKTRSKKTAKDLEPHPTDQHYAMMNCHLQLLKPTDKEYKMLSEYYKNTLQMDGKIYNIWRVDRKKEEERFEKFSRLPNHRLLWHGTNIAVVAAILSSGLRIMPHSGGRVGKGIYFASLAKKSYAYMWGTKGRGVIFLNQVALGKPKSIYRDDSSLTQAPSGFDSVVAEGINEVEETGVKSLKIGKSDVIVPYGRATRRSIQSTFNDSEYLVYNEGQARIRYMLEVQK